MPEVTCAKCNGRGKVWKKWGYFSWRGTCKTCKGQGKLDLTSFYHPKGVQQHFGLRATPPQPVTPSYIGRPTVALNEPLAEPAKGELDEPTLHGAMHAIAHALKVDLQPSDLGESH